MLNSAKYNDQEGRKALHQIVEEALKKAGKARTELTAKNAKYTEENDETFGVPMRALRSMR